MKEKLKLLKMVFVVLACLLPVSAAFAQDQGAPTLQIDRTELKNGGVIKVTGKAPPGQPVFLEVWAVDKTVRANQFDNKRDEETGKIPYIFYITHDMPAYYKIFMPSELQPKLDAIKAEGG